MEANPIQWLKDDLEKLENKLICLDEKLENKLISLDEKVDKLLEFKFKVIGGTILASLILTAAFQVMLAWIQKG